MKKTIAQNFWSHVGPHSDPTKCWLWLATKRVNHGLAYGRFRICNEQGTRLVYAHRFAYELLVGPIPEGLTIDHVKSRGCTSTLCVNPNHMEPVTIKVNLLRGNGQAAINARKTHCLRGHPYNEENTYRTPIGHRNCLACRRERSNGRSNKW